MVVGSVLTDDRLLALKRAVHAAFDSEEDSSKAAKKILPKHELFLSYRLRSGLNNLFIFSKLREASSRLYRRKILQVNIRWKALDEIYKMYIAYILRIHCVPLRSQNFSKGVVIILVKLNT